MWFVRLLSQLLGLCEIGLPPFFLFLKSKNMQGYFITHYTFQLGCKNYIIGQLQL